MKIHLIAAARPNFMKIAPIYHALIGESWAETMVVHAGQHYDVNMSDTFFRDLRLPEPHINLGVGSGTHAEQTGFVMMAYEKVLMEDHPDLVIVVGDVNSTVAATLAAVKLGINVAHLEAGLRSFDRSMPEEINRVVTDALAHLLWTPSPDADENLAREGIPQEKIVRVGNIMMDSLEMLRKKIEDTAHHERLGLTKGSYVVVTLHRPSNVDRREILDEVCRALVSISRSIPIVFPVHPRTRKNLEQNGLWSSLRTIPRIRLLDPMGYIEFISLVFNCAAVITDSGGIQEETTYLGIPCLTLRPNTERPITIHEGTNRLCRAEELEGLMSQVIFKGRKQSSVLRPELWDGRTARRVVQSIRSF